MSCCSIQTLMYLYRNLSHLDQSDVFQLKIFW
nr:MAG TPA: hypothetical protein [Bacteriophage sp.]